MIEAADITLATVDSSGNDTLIDIDNHSATFTGTWTVSSGAGSYGDNYRYLLCSGTTTRTGEATFKSASIGVTANSTSEYSV